MPAVSPTPVAPFPPGPQDRPAAGAASRVGRLIGLVRTLIVIGRGLVARLQDPATAPSPMDLRIRFCTADIRQVLLRVIRGLRRAAALEQRLVQRAQAGRDVTPSPPRAPSPARRRSTAAVPRAEPADATGPMHLLDLDRIGADAQRRPIGAVIVDICCEFGIMPGNVDRATWDELRQAIIEYGGSLARWLRGVFGGPATPAVEPAITPHRLRLLLPPLHTPAPVAAGPPEPGPS